MIRLFFFAYLCSLFLSLLHAYSLESHTTQRRQSIPHYLHILCGHLTKHWHFYVLAWCCIDCLIVQFSLLLNIHIHTYIQGKVEEDRYLKVQENQWLEKLRTLKAQEEKDRHQKHQDEVVGPVKKDLFDLLSKTGDRISDEGLENLAKFRLDL